jgi:hypothetical protein
MIALINFCVERFNIDSEQARKDTESIASLVVYKAFKGKQIALDLKKLGDDNYWTKQEKKQIVVKKRKLDLQNLVENKTVEEKFDEIIGEGELDEPLRVQKITEEGWLLTLPYRYWRQQNDGSDNELEEDTPRTALLKVPQELKILGKVGMSFSCMGIRKRGGIWQPFALYPYCSTVWYVVNK